MSCREKNPDVDDHDDHDTQRRCFTPTELRQKGGGAVDLQDVCLALVQVCVVPTAADINSTLKH